MLMQTRWQQPRNNAEVFVMVRSQPARVLLRFGERAAVRRQVFRDFQFVSSQHSGVHARGFTAVFNSPLRRFMCSKTRGNSVSGVSPVTKSLARTSPRAIVSSASRMNRDV